MSQIPNRHWHTARDANEPEILLEFKYQGAKVAKLSSTAEAGLPDLLVGYAGKWAVVEIKMPGGSLRADQERFRLDAARMDLPWYKIEYAESVPRMLEALKKGKPFADPNRYSREDRSPRPKSRQPRTAVAPAPSKIAARKAFAKLQDQEN